MCIRDRIMPDEVLVNTADTPASVQYTAKPSLSGTLFEYNQNQTRPTVSIYKPVSYTHLDVYKRQGEGWRNGRGKQGKDA